jgi:CRP-like cAMP-binding protein
MTIDDDIVFLERVPFFQRLGGGALRSVAIAAESFPVQAGELLFTAGDAADGAYVIQHGSFRLKPARTGDPEVVAGPGTLLGENALLAETKRPTTATARELSKVLRISREMFLKVLESYPDAAERLRAMIAARSDQTTRDMENIRARLVEDATRP